MATLSLNLAAIQAARDGLAKQRLAQRDAAVRLKAAQAALDAALRSGADPARLEQQQAAFARLQQRRPRGARRHRGAAGRDHQALRAAARPPRPGRHGAGARRRASGDAAAGRGADALRRQGDAADDPHLSRCDPHLRPRAGPVGRRDRSRPALLDAALRGAGRRRFAVDADRAHLSAAARRLDRAQHDADQRRPDRRRAERRAARAGLRRRGDPARRPERADHLRDRAAGPLRRDRRGRRPRGLPQVGHAGRRPAGDVAGVRSAARRRPRQPRSVRQGPRLDGRLQGRARRRHGDQHRAGRPEERREDERPHRSPDRPRRRLDADARVGGRAGRRAARQPPERRRPQVRRPGHADQQHRRRARRLRRQRRRRRRRPASRDRRRARRERRRRAGERGRAPAALPRPAGDALRRRPHPRLRSQRRRDLGPHAERALERDARLHAALLLEPDRERAKPDRRRRDRPAARLGRALRAPGRAALGAARRQAAVRHPADHGARPRRRRSTRRSSASW